MKRIYVLDNLKVILIFLVVIGHLLELCNNIIKLHIYVYMFIYLFHMPVFIFISGYLYKKNKKYTIKIFSLYIIFQILYTVFKTFILSEKFVLLESILVPYWIMWYMFSLCLWRILISILKPNSKKQYIYIIIISIIVSLLSGFIDEIGYTFSLSRTIVFFPYFVLGNFIKKYYSIAKRDKMVTEKKESIKTKHKIKNVYYFASFIIILCLLAILINIYDIIPIGAFYGSLSYKLSKTNIFIRTFSYIAGVSSIFMLFNIVPNKRLKITVLGQHTLKIYLVHGFIVKIIALIIN